MPVGEMSKAINVLARNGNMKTIVAMALAALWSTSAMPCVVVHPIDQYGAIALGGNGIGAAQGRDDEASRRLSISEVDLRGTDDGIEIK